MLCSFSNKKPDLAMRTCTVICFWQKLEELEKGKRVDQTRVNAGEVVDDLFKEFMSSADLGTKNQQSMTTF